jgi:hypothetical protein
VNLINLSLASKADLAENRGKITRWKLIILKSYEATMENGQIHWLTEQPEVSYDIYR